MAHGVFIKNASGDVVVGDYPMMQMVFKETLTSYVDSTDVRYFAVTPSNYWGGVIYTPCTVGFGAGFLVVGSTTVIATIKADGITSISCYESKPANTLATPFPTTRGGFVKRSSDSTLLWTAAYPAMAVKQITQHAPAITGSTYSIPTDVTMMGLTPHNWRAFSPDSINLLGFPLVHKRTASGTMTRALPNIGVIGAGGPGMNFPFSGHTTIFV